MTSLPSLTSLTGTGALIRLALRRDRVMLPVWLCALTASVLSTAAAFRGLYPTPESREQIAATIGRNGSLRALYGPLFAPDSIGGLTAWRIEVFGAALAGLMNLVVVVRHTRAEEETDRLELVGAGAVGRHAPLTAALATAWAADLVLALLVWAGLVILGQDAVGSLALGLSVAGAGLMFAAVAAVTAQLTEGSRTATGIAGAVLGLSYLLRAGGDAGGEGVTWLSWLSPIGWTDNVRAFADERWWVFGPVAALAAVLVGTAYALAARRDLGAGLLPSRAGPAQAGPRLRSVLALGWRLQRGSLLSWTCGFLIAGAVLGGVAEGVADVLHSSPQVAEILRRLGGERRIVDVFLASVMSLLGMVAAVYATQAALRLRAEETGQRAEPVLATAVPRVRWAGSHLLFPALGTLVLLTAAGLSAGITHGLRTHDLAGQLPRLLEAALVQAPATWVFAAIALALYGLAPRVVAATWTLLAVVLFLGWFGPILQLNQRVIDVSPFTHIPKIPGATLTATPILWLLAIGAVLAVAGLAGLQRRDMG